MTFSILDVADAGELYRRHERAVLAFSLHWYRSPDVAADLTARR